MRIILVRSRADYIAANNLETKEPRSASGYQALQPPSLLLDVLLVANRSLSNAHWG